MFENLFCAAKVQKKIINRAKTYVFSQKVSDLYYPRTKKAFRLKDLIACELCSAEEGGFEPPIREPYTGFRDQRNRPLCHPSLMFGVQK